MGEVREQPRRAIDVARQLAIELTQNPPERGLALWRATVAALDDIVLEVNQVSGGLLRVGRSDMGQEDQLLQRIEVLPALFPLAGYSRGRVCIYIKRLAELRVFEPHRSSIELRAIPALQGTWGWQTAEDGWLTPHELADEVLRRLLEEYRDAIGYEAYPA